MTFNYHHADPRANMTQAKDALIYECTVTGVAYLMDVGTDPSIRRQANSFKEAASASAFAKGVVRRIPATSNAC